MDSIGPHVKNTWNGGSNKPITLEYVNKLVLVCENKYPNIISSNSRRVIWHKVLHWYCNFTK